MRYPVLALVIVLSLTRCGIEVGNPSDDNDTKKGTLSISFAKETVRDQARLSLDLAALDLISIDDDSIIASLSPTIKNIELFGLADESEALVAESKAIPIGVYKRIAVRLNGDEPIHYHDFEGVKRPIRIADDSSGSFYIDQNFEISEGQTTSLLLSLDPYRSIHESNSSKGLVFKPQGDLRQHDRSLNYSTKTSLADARWACAYAYDLQIPRPTPPRARGAGRKHLFARPPFPGIPTTRRVTFATKDDVMKDETSKCANAFAKAPVVDGAFEFRHLLPARYSLRLFRSDGSFDDSAQDFTLDSELPASKLRERRMH